MKTMNSKVSKDISTFCGGKKSQIFFNQKVKKLNLIIDLALT